MENPGISGGKAYDEILKVLVRRREELGYSQAKLAKLWGKPQSVLAKIEIKQRNLNLSEFIELSGLLDLSADKVISEVHSKIGAAKKARRSRSKMSADASAE